MKAQCSPALKHHVLVPNRAFVVKLVNWKGNSESDSKKTSFENCGNTYKSCAGTPLACLLCPSVCFTAETMVGCLFVLSKCVHVSSDCTGVWLVVLDAYCAVQLMYTRAACTVSTPTLGLHALGTFNYVLNV